MGYQAFGAFSVNFTEFHKALTENTYMNWLPWLQIKLIYFSFNSLLFLGPITLSWAALSREDENLLMLDLGDFQ